MEGNGRIGGGNASRFLQNGIGFAWGESRCRSISCFYGGTVGALKRKRVTGNDGGGIGGIAHFSEFIGLIRTRIDPRGTENRRRYAL
jgi:hypothetical protein